MSDGGGTPEVVILQERSSVVSGTEVQEKLIAAARLFADIIRPTYGPRGLDKLLYKSNGASSVTNDGAKVVSELLVKHPAAKALVSLGKSQEDACGDGVTTVVLLAAEFLAEAAQLLRRGLHPLTVVNGYDQAVSAALEALASLVEPVDVTDEARLEGVARTAMTGKSASAGGHALARLVVDAALAVARPEGDGWRARSEDVVMAKARRGGVVDSTLLRGVRIDRRLSLDSMPKLVRDARLAVLSCPLKLEELQRTAEIEITDPERLEAFLAAEDSHLDGLADQILATGANVVMSEDEIDRRVLHRLARAGALVVDRLDHQVARNLVRASGARLVDLVSDLSADDLGTAASVVVGREEDEEGVKQHITVDGCPDPEVVTLVIGGAGDLATEEVIRGLYDALRAVTLALDGEGIVAGGGHPWAAMAAAVRETAMRAAGRERLGMEAFARALDAIPATLATNAGVDGLDAVMDLRTAIAAGRAAAGVGTDGGVADLDGVLEPTALVRHALSTAAEQAMGLLRVDQVISRRSGGLD